MTNEDGRFDSSAVPASDVSRFNLMSAPVLSDWEWRAELALIRAPCVLPDQIVHEEQKFSPSLFSMPWVQRFLKHHRAVPVLILYQSFASLSVQLTQRLRLFNRLNHRDAAAATVTFRCNWRLICRAWIYYSFLLSISAVTVTSTDTKTRWCNLSDDFCCACFTYCVASLAPAATLRWTASCHFLSVICGLTGKFELEPSICTSVVIDEILQLMDTLTTPSWKKYFSQP